MNILDRVKELAASKNISLAEVERRANLSTGSITKWGKSSPSTDKLQSVADVFDVSLDYLVGREEKVSLAEKYGVFAFDGEPVTDEEVQFLLSVLEAKRNADNK